MLIIAIVIPCWILLSLAAVLLCLAARRGDAALEAVRPMPLALRDRASRHSRARAPQYSRAS